MFSSLKRWNVRFSFKQGKTITTKEVLQKNDINPFNFILNEGILLFHTQTLIIVKHIERAVGTQTKKNSARPFPKMLQKNHQMEKFHFHI